MKIFKRIYYPVMAALLVLMLVLSLVDANTGSFKKRYTDEFYANVDKHIETLSASPRNIYESASLTSSRNYIADTVGRDIFVEDDLDETDFDYLSKPVNTKAGAVGVIQSTFLSQDAQSHMDGYDEGKLFVNKRVNNVIVYVPGTDSKAGSTADVILLTAHYDSVNYGASTSVPAAVLLESVKSVISGGKEYKNDLLFVFTDAQEEGSLGSYAFYYQFMGFNDVVS